MIEDAGVPAGAQDMTFRMLGPLEVEGAEGTLGVPSGRQQAVLASLLLAANQMVPTDDLVDVVWDARPPNTARTQVQICVSRLRKSLSSAGVDAPILTRAPGYLLRVDESMIDVHVFAHRVADARVLAAKGRAAEAAAMLRSAVSLWRGACLSGIPHQALRSRALRLDEDRLNAIETYLELDLGLGRHHQVVSEITRLVHEHPLRERLRGLLMLALYRSGRQAEALALYRSGRRLLIEELGLEPGADLRSLESSILAGDDSLRLQPAAHHGAAPAPRELPPDVLGFTGRDTLLAELDRLQALAGEQATAAVISAIDGMAGVGKTALAVHAAHRLVDRYPDGQLFVDLHGYTPDVSPVDPAAALDQMLRSLGVPGEGIPEIVQERTKLLRSRLVGKRVLLVLDNAASDAQVGPLVPGTPGSLVLITSRARLTGLDNAVPLSLDVLSAGDAVALFAQAAGEHRLAHADASVVQEITELCGYLPLAIRIAGARLRHRPTWTPHHLAELLRDEKGRLAELEAGQLSVTTALGMSYAQLTTEQQRVFRLLSLHPGPDIDAYATAALIHATAANARRVLEQLLDVHLLVQHVPGRYTFHDLVRTYAAERAGAADPEPGRRAALTRLLDHYAYTATVAMDAVYPHDAGQHPGLAAPDTPVPDLNDQPAAEAWLGAELDNLLATAHAVGHDSPDHAAHLSATLHPYLRTRARYTDAETLHHHAHATTLSTGDRTGELHALNGLGDIHYLQARYEQAAGYFGQALDIARDTGDRTGELQALNGLGVVHRAHGRHQQAADCHGRALGIAEDTGDRTGELDALHGLGQVHFFQGRYERAADYFGQALEIARDTGDRTGKRAGLTGLGYVHLPQGRYEQAADYFGQALDIAEESGNRYGELNALAGLGYVRRMQGRYEQAADYFGQALDIAQDTGNRSSVTLALTGLGYVRRMQGRYEQAADHFGQALDIAQDTGHRNRQFEAHHGLGRVHHAMGDHDRALTHHRIALDLATELDQPQDQARAHDGLAHTYHATGQHEPAGHHWQAALDILTTRSSEYTEDPHVTVVTLRAHLTELADARETRNPPS